MIFFFLILVVIALVATYDPTGGNWSDDYDDRDRDDYPWGR